MKKLKTHDIGVIGLGYVGLPVAVSMSKHNNVIGYDLNSERVMELLENFDRTREVSSNDLKAAVNLNFSFKMDDLLKCNIYIVAVPTPITLENKPDLRPLEQACELVARCLAKGDIIIFESTVYPGCTENYCVPIIERISNLKLNKDFSVGYSPERINPGDNINKFENITKVVSASDIHSLKIIENLYAQVVHAGVYCAPSIRVAEAAKVLENTQRDINIGLINEVSYLFDEMGIDTKEVLEAAKTKWNFLDFQPGLVGGHCIGIDPYYLAFAAETHNIKANIILTARETNNNVPNRIIAKANKMLINRNSNKTQFKILILGRTFKENCPDLRNSKVGDLVSGFIKADHIVDTYDPISSHERFHPKENVLTKLIKNDYDLIILAVAHKQFVTSSVRELRMLSNIDCLFFDLKSIFEIFEADFRL